MGIGKIKKSGNLRGGEWWEGGGDGGSGGRTGKRGVNLNNLNKTRCNLVNCEEK